MRWGQPFHGVSIPESSSLSSQINQRYSGVPANSPSIGPDGPKPEEITKGMKDAHQKLLSLGYNYMSTSTKAMFPGYQLTTTSQAFFLDQRIMIKLPKSLRRCLMSRRTRWKTLSGLEPGLGLGFAAVPNPTRRNNWRVSCLQHGLVYGNWSCISAHGLLWYKPQNKGSTAFFQL